MTVREIAAIPRVSAPVVIQKPPSIVWKPNCSRAVMARPEARDMSAAPSIRSYGLFLSRVMRRTAETLPPKASGSAREAIVTPVGSSFVMGARSS